MTENNKAKAHAFLKKIEETIRRYDLLRHGGVFVVALSGGPDSVALLRALVDLGYTVHAAHCNFRLRGEESNRDEMFCCRLCEELHVPLHRIHFDTESYADLHKVSVEMAARTLRYGYFERLCRDIEADGVCVAHHSDDQVETIMLNLVRGTGLRGLQGMKWRNGNILRPMLGVNRSEILAYLETIGQTYVVDHTNLEDDVQRNKMRLNILPLLEEINPAVRANVLRMAGHLAEVDALQQQVLEQQAAAVCRKPADGILVDIVRPLLAAQPSPKLLLWHLMSPYGFSRTQVDEMADCQSSGRVWKGLENVAFTDHGHLCVTPLEEWRRVPSVMRIPEQGTYVARLAEAEVRFSFRLTDHPCTPSRRPLVVTLDADKVQFPLVLRPVGAADRFQPYGMKGSKLVSDYLADRKVSVLGRRRQWVLADATGIIVWLVGLRVDNRVALETSTKRVLTVEMEEKRGLPLT